MSPVALFNFLWLYLKPQESLCLFSVSFFMGKNLFLYFIYFITYERVDIVGIPYTIVYNLMNFPSLEVKAGEYHYESLLTTFCK